MGNIAGKKKETPISFPKGDMLIAPVRKTIVECPKYPEPKLTRPLPMITETPSDQSYQIWRNLYHNHRLNREDLAKYDTRINDNVNRMLLREKEEHAHKSTIEREKSLFTSQYNQKSNFKVQASVNAFLDWKDRLLSLRQQDEKYFSPKPVRPELTPEMLLVIENASKPYPDNQALVEIDGVQLLRKDFRTLTGLNWLNDEIINAYMHLLVLRGRQTGSKTVYAFNTFFYPKLRDSNYNSVRRWTRKVDIFSFDYLLVPVHLGNHWCLCCIDFIKRKIAYFDSLGGRSNGCCDLLLEYLRYESNDKKKQDFDDENWTLVDMYNEDIPRQRNCSDCGVFACVYAEHITRQAKLSFSQEHMPYYRKKMIYELIAKRILG